MKAIEFYYIVPAPKTKPSICMTILLHQQDIFVFRRQPFLEKCTSVLFLCTLALHRRKNTTNRNLNKCSSFQVSGVGLIHSTAVFTTRLYMRTTFGCAVLVKYTHTFFVHASAFSFSSPVA